MNQNSNNQFVNLKGISIGDGMMNPLIQTQGYADLMYQLSLMDENEVIQGYIYENLIGNFISFFLFFFFFYFFYFINLINLINFVIILFYFLFFKFS